MVCRGCFTAHRKSIATFTSRQLPTYLKVWGPEGRFGWGYFEDTDMSFQDGTLAQADRMSEQDASKFNSDSIVLDLGCGTGVNAFMRARKYGCKVLGLDISTEMIDHAQALKNSEFPELHSHVFFYKGAVSPLAQYTCYSAKARPAHLVHSPAICGKRRPATRDS